MNKKKLYIIMLLLSFIFVSFSYEVQAVSSVVSVPLDSEIDVETIFSGTNFSQDATQNASGDKAIEDGTNLVAGIINNAIAIVQVIGLGIAIIMLFSLGMKYMVGSIEDKAEVKKHAMVYVIGAIIFFAATGILEILQMFIKSNFIV